MPVKFVSDVSILFLDQSWWIDDAALIEIIRRPKPSRLPVLAKLAPSVKSLPKLSKLANVRTSQYPTALMDIPCRLPSPVPEPIKEEPSLIDASSMKEFPSLNRRAPAIIPQPALSPKEFSYAAALIGRSKHLRVTGLLPASPVLVPLRRSAIAC